jgi:hypothetical protein
MQSLLNFLLDLLQKICFDAVEHQNDAIKAGLCSNTNYRGKSFTVLLKSP